MNISEFPAEFFLQLDDSQHGPDFLLGRLTIHQMNQTYWVEIDIVQKASKKIWAHVDDLYGITELDEAIDRAVQQLADYVQQKK